MPQNLSGAQVGMSPANSINNPRPNNIRGRNTFPQSYKFLTTDCYGLYNPFFWCKAERGDVQNLSTDHDLHTFTMRSPMVGDVTMKKSFIKVPMQAIYPRNWEKMMTIPTQGDDVPEDSRAILNIGSLVNHCCQLSSQIYNESSSVQTVEFFIKNFVLLENISSDGSLFARFNQHFVHRYNMVVGSNSSLLSIDDISDNHFWIHILEFARANEYASLILNDENETYVSLANSTNPVGTRNERTIFVSESRFIEILRFNDFHLNDAWEEFTFPFYLSLQSGFTGSINIEPLIAYQLACAQFATNDFVDYIYSAQLYRDNMQAIFVDNSDVVRQYPLFLYNGVYYQYDVFSKRLFDFLISDIYSPEPASYTALEFFLNLTSYVRSLRYGDYFTGAKPRPLAVGEYSAEVVDGSVSAIDITKSIQMQRLLNRVNMVGRKLGDYLAGIFGGSLPLADKDVPIFLAHQTFNIKGFETENTGDRQFDVDEPNTITSHLRSTSNKHAFEIQIDEPCYIIGMNSYDMMRIYTKTMDRFSFHFDRYDDFIPQMQYIGDQDILLQELDSTAPADLPFGYALRYMEYKQRYSYASGGFVNNLPSWAMITDNNDGSPADSFISPEYIRSSPSEFDRFYKSLTGYSLASYFHFIVAHTNITEPIRQMEYTPEILA